ncbi:MAG: protein kinase, partial [Pirellulaceae bacterium]
MISDNDSSVDIEAFGLESDDWLDRVRVAVGPPQMGTLGDYEIVEEVGYGGQGIVYRARQPRTNRDIALKRLRAGSLTGERARARFEREVEAASSLSHPNIVTVFGAEVIDNVPTLAMQWIDGVPIDEWATRTHASVPRRLGVFRKLCGAVQYAHQRGIIHRDLKPQNILVDDQDEPYVLDFGLAKLVLTDDTDHAVLTRPAEFVGTLAYAAPEQLESRPDEVDARADVYALGAVLYRVLTGNHPHDPGKPIAELIDQIRTRDVEAPSRSCADANHEIDAIVLKALRSDPRQRYQSVDALLADVKRYLSGDIVLALPPSALYQFRKLIRRHRVPFLIGAAASLAVVSLTIVLAFQTVKLTQSEDEQRKLTIDARKEEALAKAEAHKALATYEFIEQLLIRDDPFNELQPNARIKDILDDAVELLDGGAFAQQPEIEAALRLTVGRAYVALLYHSLAEQQLEVAAAMQRESYGESNPDYLMTFLHLIGSIHEQGRNEDAEVLLRRAVEVARALPRKHNNISLNAQWMQCSLLRDLGKLDEAEAAGRQALSDATIEFGPGSVEAAQSHYMLGHCLKTAGRLRDAEAHLRSALAIQRELLGAEHARVLRTMLRLGQTIGEQARYDEAIAVFKQAHRIS